MNIYYKFKLIGDDWFILFEKNGERKFIYNDRDALVDYLNENSDCYFIGGDNYYNDNYRLASIIKNGSLDGDVSFDEILKIFPKCLDVTQEIVRSNPVKLDTCMLNLNRKAFNYNISDKLNNDDLVKVLEELDYKLEFIKELFNEREDYFKWRLDLIEEFELPKEYIAHSKGRLMEDIVSFENVLYKDIIVDNNIKELIKDNKEMLDLAEKLINSGLSNQTLNFGDLEVNVGKQGLKGGMDNYVDTTGENNYLYIDFNSFGPSIIINNNLLDGICKYPERYEMLKDRRIELKSKKDNSQKYYKRLINSFIDCFAIEESKGYNPNIEKSITINGVLVMYYLYNLIKNFDVDVIEVNTDGMIIKCSSEFNEEIRNIVNELCKKLSMSCDVDVIKKIVHRNVQHYCVEFEDGSIKKIGDFGKMEDEILQTNSKRYLSECLLHYYFENDHNILEKLEEIYSRNNPELFQEIVQRTKKDNPLYILKNGEYIELRGDTNKFIVVNDNPKVPVYKRNLKGELVPYNSKFNFELVENGFENFDMSRLDLNYYFDRVLSKIESSSGKKIAIFDVDGTLVEEQDDRLIVKGVIKKLKIKLDENDFEELVGRLYFAYLKFMGRCKKEKGFGIVENFTPFLKNECVSILGEDFNYENFSKQYFSLCERDAKKGVKVYEGVEEGIINLRAQGYKIAVYTNCLQKVQKAKLQHVSMGGKIIRIASLDNSYAKSSVKGVKDFLADIKVDENIDEVIMIGNGTSDIFPKSCNIPSYILLNGRDYHKLAKTIRNRDEKKDGVIVVDNVLNVAEDLNNKPTICKSNSLVKKKKRNKI